MVSGVGFIFILVAPEIWEPHDQHSPGYFPPARSVEKRAWVRGCLLSFKFMANCCINFLNSIDTYTVGIAIVG